MNYFGKILRKAFRKEQKVAPPELIPAEIALNQEMDRFWHVTDIMPSDEHRVVYRGLFERIMSLMVILYPLDDLEARCQKVLLILKEARLAAVLRQYRQLPAGRPNTDYRKYELEYTHALVTAVAIEGAMRASGGLSVPPGVEGLEEWLKNLPADTGEVTEGPALWVRVLLPKPGLDLLQKYPMVWEDWLAYFEAPETSLMAELGQQGREWARTGENPNRKKSRPVDSKVLAEKMARAREAERGATVNRPKTAGWKVVEAIKESLADGTLKSCDPEAIVQVDCDGRTFLRVPQIYEWYHEEFEPESTPNAIRNRLKKTGVLERRGPREIFKATLASGQPPIEGIVVKESAHLWGANVPEGSIVIQAIKGPIAQE